MPSADGRMLDAVSDAVDEGRTAHFFRKSYAQVLSSSTVNKLKGAERAWDDASEFDAEKDKTKFRR